jgi:hypothetical protein
MQSLRLPATLESFGTSPFGSPRTREPFSPVIALSEPAQTLGRSPSVTNAVTVRRGIQKMSLVRADPQVAWAFGMARLHGTRGMSRRAESPEAVDAIKRLIRVSVRGLAERW